MQIVLLFKKGFLASKSVLSKFISGCASCFNPQDWQTALKMKFLHSSRVVHEAEILSVLQNSRSDSVYMNLQAGSFTCHYNYESCCACYTQTASVPWTRNWWMNLLLKLSYGIYGHRVDFVLLHIMAVNSSDGLSLVYNFRQRQCNVIFFYYM